MAQAAARIAYGYALMGWHTRCAKCLCILHVLHVSYYPHPYPYGSSLGGWWQVLEAIHLPIVPKKKAPKGKDKPEDVEDIMSKLKGMPGMENIKVCPII